ncbi:adenosine deaminase [Corynebacterium sp. TAE3-ERU2]|uniref:adenosine deaminase n=1 Tax=Corynebacterium sp. TAE3-ERU2 TaxID=2849497 RepID=UPI001C461B45|nr:adenosine deaminase [Corynebacterium sp. TAE3-ERU2]MBV7302801.1 adenosine deaminase [Corynebacterium sp. TAE3-ERU2]
MINPTSSPLPPPPREIVQQLPKVSLHDHLDGGLSPDLMVSLAAEQGYELPEPTPEALAQWFEQKANAGSLAGYLECFAHTVALMQDAASITAVAKDAVFQLAADNCVYAELRFAPELHTQKGLSMQEVVDAAITGIKTATVMLDECGVSIVVRLILCGMRQQNNVLEVAQLTVDNYHPGSVEGMVVGFDLAGPEDGFPASRFREAFELLRRHFVPVTIHAGEAAGVESIREALELGARRIGHGVRLMDVLPGDEELTTDPVARYIYDNEICLELCPHSNYQTGAVAHGQVHPFAELFNRGFACAINTDNRLVSGVTQTDEMMYLVEECGLSFEDLRDITLISMEAAFMQREVRDVILVDYIDPRMNEAREAYAAWLARAGAGSAEGETTGAGEEGVLPVSTPDVEEGHSYGEGEAMPLLVVEQLRVTPFWGDMNQELAGLTPERVEDIEERVDMLARTYLVTHHVALDGVHRARLWLLLRDSLAMLDELSHVAGRPIKAVHDILPIFRPDAEDERSRYGGYRVDASELAALIGEDVQGADTAASEEEDMDEPTVSEPPQGVQPWARGVDHDGQIGWRRV